TLKSLPQEAIIKNGEFSELIVNPTFQILQTFIFQWRLKHAIPFKKIEKIPVTAPSSSKKKREGENL
ncbi:MAG: hypothetical protein ACO2ZM_07400, partial [Francisellaceae bacterium]